MSLFFLLHFYLLITTRRAVPDSLSTLYRYMSEALDLKMTKKIEQLQFEDKFVKELKHLRLDKDDTVFWGDDDDETDLKKRVKGTSKQDCEDADFGERINLDQKIAREDKDLLNLITGLKDLKDVDSEILSYICNRLERER
jgi:hypothetical protein